MQNLKFLVFVLAIFGLSVYSWAQTGFVENLSHSVNYYIAKSSEDNIYIGSTEGLNIFDGIQNKVYRPLSHNMYGSNVQSDFFEDGHENVWFSTYQALHRYIPDVDDLEYYFLTIDNQIIKNDYRVLGIQGDTLCIHTENHLILWDVIKHTTIKEIRTNFSTVRNGVFGKNTTGQYYMMAYDFDNMYWVGDIFGNPVISTKPSKISCIKRDSHNFYIGTRSGALQVIDINNQQVQKVIEVNEYIRSIDLVQDSLVSIYTPNKHYILQKSTDSLVQMPGIIDPDTGTPLGSITAHMYTEDSVLWLCSRGKGVYFSSASKNRFSSVTDKSGKTINHRFIGIYQLSENCIIACTRKNGLVVLDSVGNFVQHIPLVCEDEPSDSKVTYNIKSTFHLKDYQILLSTNKGTIVYDHKEEKFTKYGVNVHKKQILNIARCAEEVYIASKVSPNLLILNGENGRYTSERVQVPELKDKILTSMHPLDNFEYLLSVNEEYLARISIENCTVKFIKRYQIAGGVRHVIKKKDGTGLYICNSNGLFEVDELLDTIVHHIGKDNELSQTINSVYYDKEDNLWLNTSKTILKYTPETQETYVFNQDDGIKSKEFFWKVRLQDKSGNIYLCGVNGITKYNPNHIQLSTTPSIIKISSYKINDTDPSSYGATVRIKDLDLPYNQNTLSFSFHSLDYINPKKTKVKYKLEGIDKDYINASNHKGFARYANLPPGEYTLKILGTNADGIWNPKSRDIHIKISPPFWHTAWFRILSVLLLGGITWLVMRAYYHQQLKEKDLELREQSLIIEKQKALEDERTRIAGEMHDDLGGGLTTIQFLSQKLHRKMPPGKEKETMSSIIKNTKTLVTNMSEIIWVMNAKFDSLDSLIAYSRRYAQEYMLDYDIQIDVRIEGNTKDMNMSGEKRRHIFLIIKEALHNAVKHARCENFILAFECNSNLNLTLQDDGVGLPKDIRSNANGITNIKKRTAALKGTIDFLDANPGLKIKISIPMNHN